MRWIRGVAAATVLLLTVVGAPVALTAWGRYPAALSVASAVDGSLLLVSLTFAGWLAWAVFTLATLAELVSIIRGRPVRLPGLRSAQAMAGSLLALVIATVSAPSGEHTTRLPEVSTTQVTPASPEAGMDASPVATSATADTEHLEYTVAPGDDLWSIAQRLFGDGRQWRSLTQLNPSLSDPLQELRPGTTLNIPVAHALRASAASAQVVTVVRGDTLSELAEEHLGRASQWPRIAAANPVITDPDHIEIGWKLRLPDTGVHTPPAEDAPDFTPAPGYGQHPTNAGRPDLDRSEEEPPVPTTLGPTHADLEQPTHGTEHPAAPLTVGTLAAAALAGSLEWRRALRLRKRELGRREPPPSAAADRLRTALKSQEDPDALASLVAALAAVADHCLATGASLPPLGTVRVGGSEIVLEWTEPAGAPITGFAGDSGHWTYPIMDTPPVSDAPCPFPALVSVGTSEDGEVLLVDAEQAHVLGVAGDATACQGAITAMAVELACAPWSREARLVVCGDGAGLIALAGDDRVQVVSSEQAWVKLRRVIERRRAALADASLANLRVDPEGADAVAAYVFCFLDQVDAERLAEIEELLVARPLGVSLIVGAPTAVPARWHVGGTANRLEGHLAGRPGSLWAHTIDAETRDQLSELFTEREPVTASWWTEENLYQLPLRDGDDVEIIELVEHREQPTVFLIGPADLHNATGPEPSRSRQQLIELCAWLLENPRSTASQMASGMAIAETTRRSNLSRLRTWLGNDPEDEPYLPDAYSGRISLHPAVTSDWHQLQVLLAPGLTRLPDSTLITALELVRGAPLADAVPGQWYWAEELRTEISSAIRDVGVMLAEKAVRAGDIDLARWAAARALMAAPEDELLLCARVRTEHRAGNRAEVERLVNQLTRQARVLGVDLLPETVGLCQQVIEGRLRARA